MAVKIHFLVVTCRDDCPFCSHSEKGWYCSQLSGDWCEAYSIRDMNTVPLDECPFQKGGMKYSENV